MLERVARSSSQRMSEPPRRPTPRPTHMGRTISTEPPISKPTCPHGPQSDPRFALHQRQPRADKLDTRQRQLCLADPAFQNALRGRVRSTERFSAFMAGAAYYVALERPCGRCGSARKRVRDRACYNCHISRGRENFARMRAGIAPHVARSRNSHLDLLDRQRRERDGECDTRTFGTVTVTRWPTGRLEVIFPDGYREHDLGKSSGQHVQRLIPMLPELGEALAWAGWY